MIRRFQFVLAFALIAGCSLPTSQDDSKRIVPADEFSKSARTGDIHEFSLYRTMAPKLQPAAAIPTPSEAVGSAAAAADLAAVRARLRNDPNAATAKDSKDEKSDPQSYSGDPRLLKQGYQLKQSHVIPTPAIVERELKADNNAPQPQGSEVAAYVPPAGSSAPYIHGQMTNNPSLWPDEGQGATLFRDFRAFQSMDVITIVINEITEGRKKAETDAKSEFSLTAAIANFFGLETKNWVSNNAGLDPENLLNATTSTDFKGEGETKRQGSLKARISAVIMEVLPNGLLRVEGTKIVSVDNEEEVMVISGLIRQRDVDAQNQVDSSRIANMRVDFYGRGVVGSQTKPGWAVEIFKAIWPF